MRYLSEKTKAITKVIHIPDAAFRRSMLNFLKTQDFTISSTNHHEYLLINTEAKFISTRPSPSLQLPFTKLVKDFEDELRITPKNAWVDLILSS